jgi:hypothetical protein
MPGRTWPRLMVVSDRRRLLAVRGRARGSVARPAAGTGRRGRGRRRRPGADSRTRSPRGNPRQLPPAVVRRRAAGACTGGRQRPGRCGAGRRRGRCASARTFASSRGCPAARSDRYMGRGTVNPFGSEGSRAVPGQLSTGRHGRRFGIEARRLVSAGLGRVASGGGGGRGCAGGGHRWSERRTRWCRAVGRGAGAGGDWRVPPRQFRGCDQIGAGTCQRGAFGV